MSLKMALAVASVLSVAVAFGAACGGGEEEPTRVPTPEFQPTAAGETAPPAPTPTESAPEKAEPTEAPAGPTGDAVRGEELFASNGCNGCHATDSSRLVGPGFQGVIERAATLIDGLSAEEYIEQSIRDPSAFIVDGYGDLMLKTFGDLPDQDIQDLIAYLSTLK